MKTTVDKLISLWLESKGIPHNADYEGYWLGGWEDIDDAATRETRWYLWTINYGSERLSVFLEKHPILSSEAGNPVEYDLRNPDSLKRLEKDIGEWLIARAKEENDIIESFHNKAEDLNDEDLYEAVQSMDEREEYETFLDIEDDRVRERLEEELKDVLRGELRWREENQLGVA